ncbi:hypothetical protein ACQEVB_21080 [Pseudonocardia sp. CA-107938]|uniref:hypothetical protein n=1 Tax=Pseudonocardia sp. CA-107938 TaxID=3240021 RepID=UPI003D9013B7
MIIDCDTCAVRGLACGDCVIGVLLSTPAELIAPLHEDPEDVTYRVEEPGPIGPDTRFIPVDVPSGAPTVQFAAAERRALDLFADQGLIPRLRLVAEVPRRVSGSPDAARTHRDVG